MKNRVAKNLRILTLLVLAVGVMGVVAYASVPLYTLFCKATGYNGTIQRADAGPAKTSERWVTVSFDANVDPSLPWDFKPDVHSLKAKLGETYTVKYHAHNRSDKALVGLATDNVQPDKAGSYFDKIQCFCFNRQQLGAGETAELAVQFFVDPAIADDKLTNDVQNITLSYTFFRAKDQSDPTKPLTVTSPTTAQPKTSGNPS
jgi:cytochrome c oxidase assembly protein subunit 11